jgi:ATP-binding cassette subfamily G (WHITE) protein 2 (PDR)
MATTGPWGALPQARAVATAVEEELQRGTNQREESERGGLTQSTSDQSDEISAEKEQKVITDLARTFTQASIRNNDGEHINPFLGSEDPRLDPRSEKFDARAWVKQIVSITSRDPERYPERTAGVSYRNLSCHGFGNPTDYQKTFGNYPLEAAGIWNKFTGRGQRKIQILRDFDGLVKSGEMLVVLGRPGR